MGESTHAEAAITAVTHGPAGVALAGSAAYEPGIGRVDFVVVDLTKAADEALVDRRDFEFASPWPGRISEEWTSYARLIAGTRYRAFFHVYDRTGVNLVAYDRRELVGR